MARKKNEIVEDTEKLKTPKPIGPYDIINMMFTNFDNFNNNRGINYNKLC